MLPALHRLTRGDDLRRVSRRGRRSGGTTLVVHVLLAGDQAAVGPTRVGFVVSRAVGNSVHRHRVLRRLRHLCVERLASLPPGGEIVVRALAPADRASYQELGVELDRCLGRALHEAARDRDARPGTVS